MLSKEALESRDYAIVERITAITSASLAPTWWHLRCPVLWFTRVTGYRTSALRHAVTVVTDTGDRRGNISRLSRQT